MRAANSVFHRPTEQVPIRRAATIAGLVYDAACMLPRINGLPALAALPDLGLNPIDACTHLSVVVEGGDDDIASLVPLGVVPEVPGDEARDAVVFWIDLGHD